MTPAEHEGLLLRILERLDAIGARMGALESTNAKQWEDIRLIWKELGLRGEREAAAAEAPTPPFGSPFPETGT